MPKKIIILIVLVIIAVGGFIAIQNFWPTSEPLSDSECIKYLDGRVSDLEFGRSKTEFSTDSPLYPKVASNPALENKRCSKKVSVVLLDNNKNTLVEKMYNLPPNGKGGETGYGDYNQNKNLSTGSYIFEFYYGDILFKTINIEIK